MDIRDLASNNGRPILDANHIGPLVLIFIPTFLCPAGLLVISTIIVRSRAGASFSWTWTNPVLWDYMGLASILTISVAWSSVVCTQTHIGLGTARPPDNVALFEKYEYAAELLYLLAIMLWKCTNGLCNAQIFGMASPRTGLYSSVLTAVITLGFLGALFAAAFQCDGPARWAIREKAGFQCFDRPAFWATVGGIDILSDIILHGLLAITILQSQMVPMQKRSAFAIVCLYLIAYIGTASVRLAFVTRSWHTPNYPLVAARTALATFSQLIFPMSVLCLGKLSKFLDLESYLSPAIGASSRKKGREADRDYYLRHYYYGQTSSNATGPDASQRRTYNDSVEEMPLRTLGKDGEQTNEGDVDLNDAIMVRRDVFVRNESGSIGSAA